MIDPTSVGAVPTLAILLCMALLIILLLSINNCRLMWLLRTKENLSGLSIDPESRICHENCKLLERHHQHGLSQNNEKEKIHPSNSFQVVNTQMTLVAGVSTEDLTSVPDISSRGRVTELSSVPEISPRGREPEESEIPTLESSQKFDNHTTLPFYNPKHGIGNSGYGSTHIH
ncbi:unnamed protein product [Meganyctiphanes norvegica]|uniref:Uncharacterized protein n=1 Tax=Meganyctiphanes norvegica TaxID=48144 RepID=A0AAV2RV85_MEGNR